MWPPLFLLFLSIAGAVRLLVPQPSSYSPAAALGIDLVRPSHLPKLIVFDLDHTLWTPELYQLRATPTGGEDVWLLPDAYQVLHEMMTSPEWRDTKIGIASRTHQSKWAHSLLRQIKIEGTSIAELTGGEDFIQIYKGNKRKHFEALRVASGFEFHEMLFFDDARDGKYGNCEPVAELGVHAAYCPQGITREVWMNALRSYSSCRSQGVCEVGRICDPPNASKIVSKSSQGGKSSSSSSSSSSSREDSVKMKVFSMNMPFAALLAHGVKTLESRNGTMFTSAAKEGEVVLLHVGQRQYPDGGEHMNILREAGFTQEDSHAVTTLPEGFQKGQIVAMLELGETIQTTQEKERCTPEIERAVVARGAVMGRYLTKVRKVLWLKAGWNLKGRPGMFTCDIPRSLLPDMSLVVDEIEGGAGDAAASQVDPNYKWEGGGGTDVCASAYNDDPFDASGDTDTEGDVWKEFQQRVADRIATDPTIDQKSVGSGRWP